MKVSQITANAFWKGETGVKALVEDQGKEYKASLHLKGSQVFDYSCSCALGNSYRGMCPHCKALLKAYEEQEAGNQGKPVVWSPFSPMNLRQNLSLIPMV